VKYLKTLTKSEEGSNKFKYKSVLSMQIVWIDSLGDQEQLHGC